MNTVFEKRSARYYLPRAGLGLDDTNNFCIDQAQTKYKVNIDDTDTFYISCIYGRGAQYIVGPLSLTLLAP